MSDLISLARRHKHIASSHYEGCEADHVGCLVHRLADEVERQRAEIERLLQAIGLATTAVPDMVVDVTNPLGMMQRVVAEVEKLRADLATQQGCCDGAAAQDAHIRQEREEHRAEVEKQRSEIERLREEDTKTRHALERWVYVCPDGGDEPTHERVAAVVAEVDRQRAEIARLREQNTLLREALTSIRIDGPKADGLVWVAFHHPVVAGQSYDALAGDMNRLVSQALLQFEEIRRKALEGKP